jgi:hypothetical protein
LRAVAGVLTVALLLAMGALTLRSSGEAPVPGADREELRSVLKNLERERRERELLADEVQDLRVRLDLLEWDLAASGADHLAEAGQRDEGTEDTPARESLRDAQPPAFDGGRLVRAGTDEREAARLRALWAEIELAKLYVIDRAEREGWSRSRRYEELQALQGSVRASLDDDSYDRYLYAAGTPNRVVVRDVIDQSPADRAGIRPGDTVVSYDGSRVFARAELREATSFGEEGQQVRLEILRNGRSEVVTVPRGPLGLLLMSQLHEPR